MVKFPPFIDYVEYKWVEEPSNDDTSKRSSKMGWFDRSWPVRKLIRSGSLQAAGCTKKLDEATFHDSRHHRLGGRTKGDMARSSRLQTTYEDHLRSQYVVVIVDVGEPPVALPDKCQGRHNLSIATFHPGTVPR